MPTEETPTWTHSAQFTPGADAKRHEILEMCFEMNMKNGGGEQGCKKKLLMVPVTVGHPLGGLFLDSREPNSTLQLTRVTG